jgi:AP-4 complex subunit mu-1
MAPISQFFILSPRGDSIIFRDFRHDCPKTTTETFFRNAKFWKGQVTEAPPIFNIENLNYLYVKKNTLYFVFVTRDNVSPNYTIELLIRITKVIKDYCGVLSEESVRTNFVLIYELIDEILDFGYVQGTSSEHLKNFVYTEPIVLAPTAKSKTDSKTIASSAVDKPIQMKGGKKGEKRNEIFVDIFERINITFNANGFVLNSSIDGTIQMKSYLAGNPELKLALNEDLIIGRTNTSARRGVNIGAGEFGNVEIDDCNFHECVKLTDFDSSRILSFVPPDGEFTLMNYRVTGEFRAPFRIAPYFEFVSPYKVELIVKIRGDIPDQNYASSFVVSIPMPKGTSGVSCDVGGAPGHTTEYDQTQRLVLWKIKKFNGNTEQACTCRIALSSPHTATVRKEIGPINLAFEIPMFNPSGLQVRYLRILEGSKTYNPYRWVRFVTRSQSYVCRL